MNNPQEKLTNGGKPHVCAVPAIHNNTKGECHVCDKCFMPVDAPQENSISSYISAREREFEEKFGELMENAPSFDGNGDVSYPVRTDDIKAFNTASMKGLVDVLRDVINEIEICTCKPGDACNVCGGNKDKGVKEKMLEALSNSNSLDLMRFLAHQ